MTTLPRRAAPTLIFVLLAGCAQLPGPFGARAPDPAPATGAGAVAPEDVAAIVAEPERAEAVVAGAGQAEALPADRRTAEDFDTTTEAERAVAVAAAETDAPERDLGTTVASLGDATSPGLWLETPLVTAVGPGRLDYPERGTSVLVELRPSGGAAGSGSRVSLAAMRLLEAGLTDLPTLRVFAR